MDVERASQVIVAQQPRRLRLDELLRELGAQTDDDRALDAGLDAGRSRLAVARTTDARAPDDRAPDDRADNRAPDNRAPDNRVDARAPDNRADRAPNNRAPDRADGRAPDNRVSEARRPSRPESLTVGELVDKAAEAGFGFLVGVLTLIAIPFFGLSTPFGLAIALVGFQLLIGLSRPWLPQRARRRQLSMAMLDRVLGILARRTKWLSKSTRRRWEVLIMPRLVGLGIVLLALGLALPLPIPGSNMIFLVPLFVYAIGFLERDGVWIALGHVGALVDLTLLVVFGATVITVLERCWHWIF